jgi:GNAT superfamily N-acetyltransferase
MINILASLFDPEKGFQGGYDRVTGGKTFSTHVPLDVIRREARKGLVGVALCVSVAVLPDCASHGFAVETLNRAIAFAEACGLAAVPYSAPRGFAKARAENPLLDIMDYLNLTLPPTLPFDEHASRICNLNRSGARLCCAFGGVIPVPGREMFEYYSQLGPDDAKMPAESAFREFLRHDALVFEVMQGRRMTVEDFCILMGRRLRDPVMRLHIENGARYIRNDDVALSAVFADSRPEDRASLGYNVLLSYNYNPLLVGLDLR